jgi:4'-phosphopantetheinyl transferase
MQAYWLEQIESDVPTGNQWLSAGEMARLTSLCFEKRRTDWRLGRWTAKRALAACLNLPVDVHSLQDIEIRAAPSGSPEVFVFDQRASVPLSLSHRAGKALCVVGLSGTSLGCDLELVESRDHSFLTDFFSANEQRLIGRARSAERPMLLTLLWSAKESALKAFGVGLRLDTTSLDVSPADPPLQRPEDMYKHADIAWSPLSLRRIGGPILRGWWRCANNMVRTVVFNPLG